MWSTYKTFKRVWLINPGNNSQKWDGKTFSGEWDISFRVDTTVVTSDPAFVDCEALQAEVEAQNPSTLLGTFIRCSDVAYDGATGLYTAHFTLVNPDGSKVTGKQIDENQPDSLHLTTPAQAFYVKQSDFEVDKTFVMTEPTVKGEISMDQFFIMMPITFEATGDDVTLTMTQTYDAEHTFVSGTPGRSLPTEVTDLLPATQTMLMNGTEATPTDPAETSVRDGQGVWIFAGWQPESALIEGANVSFTGTWVYEVDPAATFTVRHTFVSADETELPDEIRDLTPESVMATQGNTVTPTPLATTSVKTETGTWNFTGWQPETAIIDGADVEFTGTWNFKKAVIPPVDPVDPVDPDPNDPDPIKPDPAKPDPVTPEPGPAPKTPLATTGGAGFIAWSIAGIALILAGVTGIVVTARKR
ncbi:SHIRT domain-containing protein [Leucobacter chinensis]|uniref:SHIRT domain-containing protein n=1 Tax=Leucobacter chinensis TaxID=2851010 RepID=UPI001C22FB81|nr:SHIRT domain-containing protein [Leucobacter chinensis]